MFPKVSKPQISEGARQDEQPGTIKGRRASSLLEWWVWKGLMRLGWPPDSVMYQVNYFGGNRLRGGQILDFLVPTVPLSTPIYANGTYWHSGARQTQEDLFAQRTLYNKMKGSIKEPLIVWDKYLAGLARHEFVANTAEEAHRILATHIGPY